MGEDFEQGQDLPNFKNVNDFQQSYWRYSKELVLNILKVYKASLLSMSIYIYINMRGAYI
jgi:hypothetical protein